MHEDMIVLIKTFNKKINQLDDKVYELQRQYDQTQYELRCIKMVLKEICQTSAPHHSALIEDMLDQHDKVYKTLYGLDNTQPLASIRYAHQMNKDLGSAYVWL